MKVKFQLFNVTSLPFKAYFHNNDAQYRDSVALLVQINGLTFQLISHLSMF